MLSEIQQPWKMQKESKVTSLCEPLHSSRDVSVMVAQYTDLRPQPSAISPFLFNFIIKHHQDILHRWSKELDCHVLMKKRSFSVSGSAKAQAAFQRCVHDEFAEFQRAISNEELAFLIQLDDHSNAGLDRLGVLMDAWKGRVGAECSQSIGGACVVFAGTRNCVDHCCEDIMRFRSLLSALELSW